MKRKKGNDFPEINYTFMDKSKYRKKNYKFRRNLKRFISIVIICLFLYIVLFWLVISKDPNFFDNFSQTPEESSVSTQIDDTEETVSSTKKEDPPVMTNQSTTPPVDIIEPNSLTIQEKISLQMELYGLKDEKEIQIKKDQYHELTGEFFDSSFLFPSDVEIIPDEIIYSSNREQAAVLRNEIFARHGYPFESGRLLNYFKLKKWYERSEAKIELSDLEKANVNKILQYEISKGWKQK